MDNRFLLRKNIFLVIISLLVLSSNAWAAIQYGAKDLGVMWFIGDSITQSNADGDNNGSPRKSLYDLLVAGGYDFSYTGHWQVNIDGLPSTVTSGGGRGGGGAITEEFYYYHSGVSASVIGDNYGSRVGMTENLPSFWTQGRLATAKPDVILIMLGTNDVGNGIDLANAPSRLVTFVQRIHELPDVGSPTVFLASIPPSRRTTQGAVDVIAFNSFVPGIVADFQTQGKDVHFVDQFTPLDNNYATVMRPDNLHPNAAGNDTMAEQWFHGIVEVVTDPNVVALIGVTPQTGKAPMEVHFDASASRAKDSIASYNWDFGDGNSISGMTAAHTYLQAGTFRATLTVTDIHNVTDTASVNIVASEWPGTPTDFYSFYLYTFATNGLDCKVAVPDVMAEGKPWVWRARFWGHEPGPDIELLRHGFHVVYVDVAGLYGAPSAVARFDAFYDFLTVSHGFDRRAVLEGMSRGGLIIYNWAAQNADKIHCVYADAPVCDFKSWPGITTEIMAAYGFSSVAEADAYLGNPVDNMQPLAEAGIPLLHVVGDLDTTVPVAENTAIVEERYRAFGGWIEVIHKPEAGHTHGLDDPTPIVDFILNGMRYLYNRPASNITFGSATFKGILSLPGLQYDIQVYWGTSDGGTDITAWD
jgi:PKD repeat protein